MGGEQAANVLATVQRENIESEGRSWSEEEEKDFKLPILNKYEKESSALYSTARLWDDGIIHPADTRKVRPVYDGRNVFHIDDRLFYYLYFYRFWVYHSLRR